jgi:Anti-anti-sigma regulatory factor (antagonist of anti-sigma factor)
MQRNKIEWKILSPEVMLLIPENVFAYPEIMNLKYVLFARIVDEKKKLIIDCSKIEYIDNTAIRVIIGLNEILGKMQLSLGLCNMQPSVKDTVIKSGLAKIVKTYIDLQIALKEMGEVEEVKL